ncbi:MAG: Mov34/MPN/PAD-1 family protein [Candidatus Methanoplasma sp.]|jgi:hypothetical protein|nr:Mov34/MPN/PAD-1 family protein [Candidatus Methanoplasma sp.]
MSRVYAVSEDFIDWINYSAKSAYPDEFICFHGDCDGVIREMILVSSTYGRGISTIDDWMTPSGMQKTGTVHSHPEYSNEPSDMDLDFFRHYGGIHIITCRPYDRTSWKAYDSSGRVVDLKVVP